MMMMMMMMKIWYFRSVYITNCIMVLTVSHQLFTVHVGFVVQK
jgi:hypothetical protein